MLTIEHKSNRATSAAITVVAFSMLAAGIYLLILTASPTVAPLLATSQIDVASLPEPTADENRIIIPKIGVNIHYESGAAALDRGAEWRYPERGNPEIGGNFIIAAHRFSIQPTPQGTIEKSPFYNIDKLAIDDKIVVDYNGARYAYQIDKMFDVKPTQIEIEAPSETPKLTLYSCELSGPEAGRVVVTAQFLGKVNLNDE